MNKKHRGFIGFILFLVGAVLISWLGIRMQNTSTAKATGESAVNITALTNEEQKEIDTKVLQDWGNPRQNQLRELKNGFTEKDIATSGDVWYYLTGNITAKTDTTKRVDIKRGNIRILLNGYSIAGDLQLRAAEANTTLSIFDKIPGKSGKEYNYNPNAIKYYKYDTESKGYTNYSTTKPSGEDVTNMPTWQEDTYIKVTGSAFASNEMNTDAGICYLSATSGILNMYDINIVGRKGHKLMLYAIGNSTHNNKGLINLYRCDLIGNFVTNGYGAICLPFRSVCTLKGCNIYGNQDDGQYSDGGIQPSDTKIPSKESDISIITATYYSSRIIMQKSNVGAIANIAYNATTHVTRNKKVIYLKDVDFRQEVSMIDDTVSTFFNEKDGICGTIELVYGNQIHYKGNSPNLNIIMHGGDNDVQYKRGFNDLKIGERGVVGNIKTVFGEVDKEITINGKATAGISSTGNVRIGIHGSVTMCGEQKIGGECVNNGNITIQSGITVMQQLYNSSYGHFTIQSGRVLAGTVTNYGDFVVESQNNIFSTITNRGRFTIQHGHMLVGTITNYNEFAIIENPENTVPGADYGTFAIIFNVTLKITSGPSMRGTIVNRGTLMLSGPISIN